MAVCGRNMSREEVVIGVVVFLTELYCVSRYTNATRCLNTILEGIHWIHLAQDRDQLLALANVVMNIRVQ
jgi:hypothetical protein